MLVRRGVVCRLLRDSFGCRVQIKYGAATRSGCRGVALRTVHAVYRRCPWQHVDKGLYRASRVAVGAAFSHPDVYMFSVQMAILRSVPLLLLVAVGTSDIMHGTRS